MIEITKKCYYNIKEYDNGCGIGFYPKLFNEYINYNFSRIINIEFILLKLNDEYIWKQNSGSVIYGFTKQNGSELLFSLNNEIKKLNIIANKIFNNAFRQIYPRTNNATFYILDNYFHKVK